ncbi:sensor domain-containing protein [Mycolicibacterium septicum DSM 44393]|uniref:Sensor domain-containing protein n=1 Tax=Mycolicibacterium septicum DSM 44393 TaxID=1341646 RepID=A0A7X6RWN9_9MYCO|nr:sensor domain-containing protein [Mycolicibacterium septicum]NKZ12578.1 sensor domain-containing protein [Mycolicibacterium septicum DSM 44393]
MSEDAKSLTQSAERWLSLAALVVAPTSLITGLCYFFGLLAIRNRLHYFGVDPGTVGYTSADYVVTTIGTFFFASLRVLIVLAILVVLTVAFRHWAATGRRITLLRNIAWLLTGLGAVGLIVAVVWLVSDRSLIKTVVDNPPDMYMAATIAAGIVLLVAGYWTLTLTGRGRLPKMAERILLALAVAGLVVALFWATDLYAVDQGKHNGADAAGRLWAADGDYTAVQVDTTEALNIPDNLVKMTVLPAQGPPAAPVYRYQCLRVLEAHAGRYVLVPARWSREQGYAITVTPDATHRVTSVVDSTPVVKGWTVDEFWQCPEVVRTYQQSDLEPILIGPERAQELVGAGSLSVTGPDTNSDTAPANGNPSSSKGCVPEGDPSALPAALPPYPKVVAATREREITGAGPSGRVRLQQRAMIFPDPAAAENFMTAVQEHWGYCAGKTTAVYRHGEAQARTIGTRVVQKSVLSVTDSTATNAAADCAQALAAKSNIVVAVDLCGAKEPSQAAAVAYDVRNRIPTDY